MIPYRFFNLTALTTLAALVTAPLGGCNPENDFHAIDHDGDGYNYYEGDCNDDEPTAYPSAPELCDGLDNNCDGRVDEGVGVTVYLDEDGDGHGVESEAYVSCQDELLGYAATADDCDDSDRSVYPGAPEACDEVDQDCDGQVDEGLDQAWYPDGDADGWGDEEGEEVRCDAPEGYVGRAGDCDDLDGDVHPEQEDPCRDGVDQDCSGEDAWCLVEDWVSLPGDAGLALYGVGSSDGVGAAVLSLGDLDGDGSDELLVSAPNVDAEESNNGALYLLDLQGRAEGSLTPEGRGDLNLWSVFGGASGDRLAATAGSWDLDGDGALDLAVGAPQATGDRAGTGAVYLLGHAGLLGGASTTAQADLTLLGASQGDDFGQAVARVADWTGDGNPDLVVGAPGLNESNRANRGALYLLALCPAGAGSACGVDGGGSAWGGSLSIEDIDARLIGVDAQDALGAAVAGLGDFLGDGRDLLAVSAPGAAGGGAVYLLHQDAAWAGDDPDDEATVVLRGSGEDDQLGAALALIPDMDGDGRGELFVGAPGVSEALVFYSGGFDDRRELTRDDADLLLIGPEASALGAALSAGDLDGDGLSDLLIGAPEAEDGAGALYLVFGEASGQQSILLDDLAATSGGSVLVGADRRSAVGASLSCGDFDGDGYDDVLVGAPEWDVSENTGNDAGAAFVLYGGPTG